MLKEANTMKQMLTLRRYIRSSMDVNATFNNKLFVSKLLITIHLKGKYNYKITASPTAGCILALKQMPVAAEPNVKDVTVLELVKSGIKLRYTYINMIYLEGLKEISKVI